jgi:hypothetical protein
LLKCQSYAQNPPFKNFSHSIFPKWLPRRALFNEVSKFIRARELTKLFRCINENFTRGRDDEAPFAYLCVCVCVRACFRGGLGAGGAGTLEIFARQSEIKWGEGRAAKRGRQELPENQVIREKNLAYSWYNPTLTERTKDDPRRIRLNKMDGSYVKTSRRLYVRKSRMCHRIT